MSKKLENLDKALNILYDYKGTNPYILMIKRDVYIDKKPNALGDFQIEFILKNHDFEPIAINKITKIPDWYGEDRQTAWNLEFKPTVIKIVAYLGETERYYCCYVKYRQTIDPVMCFVPKRAIINNFLVNDFHDYKVDFNRYDNLSTTKDPNRKLRGHQKEGVQFLLSRKRCILADDMGLGKMEPVSSLIPTPEGFKMMGDIVPGDKIFGSDGKVHNVLETYNHINKDIYRVTFTDGTYVDCGLEHLWLVRTKNNRKRKQDWQVKTVKELLELGLQWNEKKRIEKYGKGSNKFEIPVCEPVEYTEKDYLIHPYILGVCIGDGNMCNDGIHISIPDNEIETAERILELLPEYMTLSVNRSASCPRHNIIYKKRAFRNDFLTEIRRLGLNVHGNYKFIPEEYKLGSIEQRKELLCGLLDSDGSIRPKNKINYSTNSERLAYDVRELVNSLGGIARVHAYKRIKNSREIIEYHVMIQVKFNPFKLKRKHDMYITPSIKYCHRYIEKIEYAYTSDAKCLYVDSFNHSYLTNKSYTVTHNTNTLSVAAIEGNFDSVLIICPATLKYDWKKELMWYIPEKDITVIEGGFETKTKTELEKILGYAEGKSGLKKNELISEAKEMGKWRENRFVIVNYDILDEFYDFSRAYTDAAKQRVLENSPILKYITNKKTCLIVDEAHKLSNSTSKRYKVIKNLIKKGNPECVFLTTGTPITNNPLNLFCILSLIENQVTSDIDYYKNRYCGAKQIYAKGEYAKWKEIYLNNKGKGYYDLTKEEQNELKDFINKHAKKITMADGATNLDELKECIAHIYLRRTKEDIGDLPPKHIHELYYDLNAQQQIEYNKLWDEYLQAQKESDPEKELNKDLLEGGLYRRYLSNQMVPNTINLCNKILETDDKIIIACCYDEELYTLKEYYGKQAVIINGKCTPKEKEKNKVAFLTNPDIKVLIGNINAAGVGLTLIVSKTLIFNNISYSAADDRQMEDRIHRIGQTRECDIYYQIFRNTQYQHMWDIVLRKQLITDTVIKKESEK